MTLPTALLLVAAGFAAGVSSTVAGLASLFSYPALLAAGLAPLAANVTNTVALTVTSVGAAAASRTELRGQGPSVRRFAPVVLLGGAAGAGLLLLTPPGGFEAVVPVLIAAAGVVLLLQPRIRRAAQRRTPPGGDRQDGDPQDGDSQDGDSQDGDPQPGRTAPVIIAGMFGTAVYGGYFGAGAGVLMLALLLVGLPLPLLRSNALKNVLLGLANAVAAVGFAVVGPVHWVAVAPLAAGLLAGSGVGPAVARRLPAGALRIGIGVAALGLAAALAAGLL